MKKTTAYGRRVRREGNFFNGARWVTTLAACSPYTADKPMCASPEAQSPKDVAATAMARTRLAFERIKTGLVPPHDVEPIDLLSHAMDVACIRAGQIGPDDAQTNPLLAALAPANQALQRCSAA